MVIDRRKLIIGGAAIGAGTVLPAACLGAGTGFAGLYATARKDRQGRHSAVILDLETWQEVASLPLPARGHGIAARPAATGRQGDTREFVAFARRPGNFAVVFIGQTGAAPLWLESRPDRHFFGHGIFSPDGRLLYTTENDFESGEGRIGVRDVTAGYRQIGDMPAGGIDPHELALLSDGRTLVVANGGIRTHPQEARIEADLGEMQPSLAYVDCIRGEVIQSLALPEADRLLSIRHLAVGARDTVIFGCQYRGAPWQLQPVVGMHRRGEDLRLLAMPEEITLGLSNYVASVAVDAAGECAVVTAPRGGMAVLLDVAARRYSSHVRLAEVSGVAPSRQGFVLTSETGELASLSRPPATLEQRALPFAWDNHLTPVR